MSNQAYCDDIGAIIITGPVVRFDLMVHSTTQRDSDGKPKLVVEQTVIMPIDAFLRATTRMQNSVQDMVKKGVITRSSKGAQASKDQQAGAPKK